MLLQNFKYKYMKIEAFAFNAAKYKIIFVYLTPNLGFDFACYNGERKIVVDNECACKVE